jgi:hypothetical protein
MPVTIDCDFCGGNIIVDEIRETEILLHQDLRDTTTDWFYWYFRVRNGGGRTLRFQFTQSRAIGARGPAVSYDDGETWEWMGSDIGHGMSCPYGNVDIDQNWFDFTFPGDTQDVRFSFGMPYQFSRWERFASEMSDNAHFEVWKLCETRKGRSVPFARVGCVEDQPRLRMFVTARHHCCEMMAGYSIEGLLGWIACDASDEAKWMRDNVEVLAVPFADLDGVEDGDQGKNRDPRDHGRDYEGESLYPACESIREMIPAWSGGKLRLVLDLHCPWIAGNRNEVIYVVGSPDETIAEQQRVFSDILETTASALPFKAEDYLPFGVDWNVPSNTTAGKSPPRWAGEQDGVRMAGTIEVAYANALGAEVTQETALLFGHDIGKAAQIYLSEMD